jgi:hypothetical protein
MNQIVLNQDQLAKLEAFIQEMPMKYAMPLVQFLNEIAKEQQPEVTEE